MNSIQGRIHFFELLIYALDTGSLRNEKHGLHHFSSGKRNPYLSTQRQADPLLLPGGAEEHPDQLTRDTLPTRVQRDLLFARLTKVLPTYKRSSGGRHENEEFSEATFKLINFESSFQMLVYLPVSPVPLFHPSPGQGDAHACSWSLHAPSRPPPPSPLGGESSPYDVVQSPASPFSPSQRKRSDPQRSRVDTTVTPKGRPNPGTTHSLPLLWGDGGKHSGKRTGRGNESEAVSHW